MAQLVWRPLSEIMTGTMKRASPDEVVLSAYVQKILADADALFQAGCGKGMKTLRQRLEEQGCVFDA